MEAKGSILIASINNQVINTTNITQISEDLWYIVQSDMDEWAFQVQRMLADKLDQYKGKGNKYVDNNIQEIQELYAEEEKKEEKGVVEREEVILVRSYEASSTTLSSSRTSFITDEVENLLKYMKFMKTPSQTRIFRLLPYYQSLKSRGKQDPIFWKEVAITFLEQKHNMETVRNGYQIPMFQGGPPHKPYFIAMDNKDQIIIGSSKKIVATHVVGELEILVWLMGTWILKWGYCYDQCLLETAWTWAKGMMITISCAEVVSVSASCSRYHNLISSFLLPHAIWFLCFIDYMQFHHVLMIYIA